MPHNFAFTSFPAHLVGIGGAGMRSLADLLDAGGWEISGSDLSASSLVGLPFDVHQGHDADMIDDSLDLLVCSDAVPDDNPELARTAALGV